MPRGQQYAVGVVQWFLTLVLDNGASLRCAAAVLGSIGAACGRDDLTPDRSTGRLWLLRLGLAALLRPKVIADDWAWLIDHSIQIGPCKCLVILGIRLSELPEGRALDHRDLEPIALVPMIGSTKQAVAACLEAAAQPGAPRVILDDHGADLHGGVEIFRAAHPGTAEVYDITHKAACLLKARLEGDERWKSFGTDSGQAKVQMQQTEMAGLVPPSQRSKARFMNVGKLVDWGAATLALLDDPGRLEPLGITGGRMREKLGWLEGYREALGEWSGYQAVIDGTLDFVRRRGLYAGAEIDLAAAVPDRPGAAGGLRGADRLRAGAGVEGAPGGTATGDDGGGRIVLRQAQGIGGRPVEGRLHGFGAEPRRDGLGLDGGSHRRGAGTMSGARCAGLVPGHVGPVGSIAEATGIREAGRRNKSGMNAMSSQAQVFTAPVWACSCEGRLPLRLTR